MAFSAGSPRDRSDFPGQSTRLLRIHQGADSGGGEAGVREPPASAARCSLCFFICSIDWRCLLIAKPTVPPMTPAIIRPAIGTQRGNGSGDPSSKWAAAAIGTQANPVAERSCSVRLFTFHVSYIFTAKTQRKAKQEQMCGSEHRGQFPAIWQCNQLVCRTCSDKILLASFAFFASLR